MRTSTFLAVAATLGLVSAAGAQSPAVQDTLRNAERLQAEGNWARADALLEKAVDTCGSGADARACRLEVDFSRGYVADREADRDDLNRDDRLRLAEAYYKRVLSVAPAHAGALNNLSLVYERLDRSDEVDALLREALRSGAGNDGEILTLLGNLYSSRGQWERALSFYEAASDRLWRSAAPRRAQIEVYANLPPASLTKLIDRAAEWEARFPDVASEAYQSVFERGGGAPVERAVVRWVQLLARVGRLTQTTANELPEGDARRDLLRFLKDPEGNVERGWWHDRFVRANALAAVALAAGRERLAAGDAKGAMQRWESGARLAPDYEAYQYDPLRQDWLVRLDLHRELALLYASVPALDPERRKFNALVSEIFQGKMNVYALGDLEPIQRFHTTLGIICFRTDICGERGYVNAIFQLESAVTMADRIEDERGGAHQPLEELKAMLAEALLKWSERPKAYAAYLKAAQAALDEDHPVQARQHWDAANRLAESVPAGERAGLPGLAAVIATRLEIEAYRGDQVEAGAAFLAGSGRYAWLNGAQWPGSNAAFRARQRFKALSDLAARFERGGQPRRARETALRAFEVVSVEVKTLIGLDDLERLEAIRRIALQPARVTDGGIFVKSVPGLVQPAGQTWKLYLPSEPLTTTAWISTDLLLAQHVRQALSRASSPATQAPMRIEQGRITLFGGEAASAPGVEALLGALPGAKAVNVDANDPGWSDAPLM